MTVNGIQILTITRVIHHFFKKNLHIINNKRTIGEFSKN